MQQGKDTLKAKVKSTGEQIEVYKLKSGGYCSFLGDKLTLSAVEQGNHQRVFKADYLTFN